jgi:ABC-type Fe3+ transport system substrate-binding protein
VKNRPSSQLGFVVARGSGAVAALLAALCCTAPVRAQTLDQLYASAKGEKALVLWAAGPTAAYERATQAFEQQFPGITVSLTGGLSNALNARIEEQISAKKIETDLTILQTIQDLIGWHTRGLLLPFKPDGFDKIDREAKNKDGTWIAVIKMPIFYGYNTEHVQHNQVPQLALDFLQPRFKGKLITTYPADDDAGLFAFATIIQKYGWGYMTQYMKQQPKFVQGHLGVARSLASGESTASFDSTASSTLEVKRGGGKVALAGSSDDYLPVSFAAEAIFKDAPHPNAAKLFVTWYLSKDWQSRSGVYSPRSDVPAPAGLPPLSNYRLEERYADFVSNEAQVADLRTRLERYTGPVTNAGGAK